MQRHDANDRLAKSWEESTRARPGARARGGAGASRLRGGHDPERGGVHPPGARSLAALIVLTGCQIDLGGPSAPADEPGAASAVGAGSGVAPGPGGGVGPAGTALSAGAGGSASATNPFGAPASGGPAPGELPGASAGSSPAAASPVATPAPGAANADCDLSGRWLVVQRDGISVPSPRVDQVIQAWLYYELRQDGAALRVEKGLDCGYRVLPLPPPPAPTLAATGDASAAWPGILANDTHTGRTGNVVPEAGTCRLHLDDEVSVRGATATYYADPSRPLPAPGSPPATPTTPGWEDWDGDGNPGISVRVESVLVRGQVHVASRERSVYDGSLPSGAGAFAVPIRWSIEQSTLATTPANDAFLANNGLASPDPSSHYAYFLALGPEQGSGSDAEICAQMRALAASLPASELP